MSTRKPAIPDSPLCHQPVDYHLKLMEHGKQKLGFSGGDFRKWQTTLRRKLRELMGTIPPNPEPPRVQELWTRPHPLGTIQKILIRSEAHYDVPAYVCLPKNATPPFQFVICLQGHSTGMHNSIGVSLHSEKKPQTPEGDRDFAIGCMQRGLAALCIEQRAFGETRPNPLLPAPRHAGADAGPNPFGRAGT